MNSRANCYTNNHFGNPLITATTGSGCSHYNNKAPASPAGSTFSKNDNVKTSRSFENLLLVQYQQQQLQPRTNFSMNPQQQHHQQQQQEHLQQQQRILVSQITSFAERELQSNNRPSSSGDCSSIPLYVPTGSNGNSNSNSMLGSSNKRITTTASIGLPSQYPGSSAHNRSMSLESSVLEELQDFDDFFGTTSSSSDSLNDNIIQNNDGGDGDGDDDLHTSVFSSSRSAQPTKGANDSAVPSVSLLRRNHVSELASSSLLCIPPSWSSSLATPAAMTIERPPKTTIRKHRRSQNFAMGSKEFYNAVLKEL